MDKQDEFQELIRSFSLDQQPDQDTPSGEYQPLRRQAPPAGAAPPQAMEPERGVYQPAAGSAPSGQPVREYVPRPPREEAPPPEEMQPRFRERAQAVRGFNPDGFDVGAKSGAPAGFNPAGFDEAISSAQSPVATAAPPAAGETGARGRAFQLNIDSEEYAGIPDSAPASVLSQGGAQPPRRQMGNAGFGAAPPPPARGGKGGRGDEPPKPPKKRRRRGGGVSRFMEALVLVAGAVACAIFLSIFALQSASDMLGINKPDKKVEFVVAENATVGEVAEQLKEAGIITQPLTFKLYAGLKDKKEYVPGTYELNTKMAYDQIMTMMTKGNTEKEVVWVTFPEGQTLNQVAQKLEENKVCSAEEFIKVTDTVSFGSDSQYGYEFYDKIPDDPLRYHKLEGYIFPDTYQFYVGENVESVVNKFLSVFNTRVTQDLYDLMEKQGMTLDETLALASIIQKEAGDVQYMYDVSSVFHNRLQNAAQYPRLESDATYLYVRDEIEPNLTSKNEEMAAAYDTYQCQGLPVGPINNPGLDAIKAALAPAETNYFYFLSDQKHEYHFAATLQEHNLNLQSAGEAYGTSIDHSDDASSQQQ